MKLKYTPSNLTQPNSFVNQAIEVLVSETQIAVAAVLTPVSVAPPAGTSYSFIMTNRSLGGQIIRVGNAPSFAPAAGMSLAVGDSITINNVSWAMNAISSAPGGLLDCQVVTP